MLSPEAFAEFVVPLLGEQCAWLDYSVYHLDGTDCIRHLDHLLAIEELNAVQWSVQSRDDLPGPGDPHWYGLYKRILRAGKSVQIAGVELRQVMPLLDALGPDGVFLAVDCECEHKAREIEEMAENYR